jgi:hypothetical protein
MLKFKIGEGAKGEVRGGEKETIEQEKLKGGESENTFHNYRIISNVGVRSRKYSSGSGWLGNSA